MHQIYHFTNTSSDFFSVKLVYVLIYHFDRRKLSIEIGIRADIPFCCILRNFRSELWIGTTALVPVINYFISGPRIISTHIPIYNLYLQRIGIETGISSDVPFINCKFSGKKSCEIWYISRYTDFMKFECSSNLTKMVYLQIYQFHG